MAQLDQGGFILQHDDGSGWKTSAYVFAQDVDLIHSVEHWVMVIDPVSGANETEFKMPSLGTPSTEAKLVRDSSTYSNVTEFLNLRYHTPSNGGHARRYIRCDCTKMSL